ncbi:MAG: glycosyltransferase [Acidobacteriota bacterium]|nr:glycosyltransferase [Acidobacteriota bacterium]
MTASNTPQISFAILCYNTERYVGECIQSVLAMNSGHDFEIVALDDHSSDGTLQTLRKFKDPRLRVIAHRKNMGHAVSIGHLLEESRGEYVARIDSDDRYRPEFLSEAVPILDNYSEVGLVYADACLIDSEGKRTQDSCDLVHQQRDFKGGELIPLLHQNFICAPTIIARRQLWLNCLPVPPSLAFHDWYFTVLMARQCEFYFRNRVLADYRVHAGNLHSRITLDGTEEASIFRLLQHVFQTPETDAGHEQKKQSQRRSVYGRQYLTLADKYFGATMNSDARRCYWRAICNMPALTSVALLRRFTATFLPRELYENCKSWSRFGLNSVAKTQENRA